MGLGCLNIQLSQNKVDTRKYPDRYYRKASLLSLSSIRLDSFRNCQALYEVIRLKSITFPPTAPRRLKLELTYPTKLVAPSSSEVTLLGYHKKFKKC